jgi:YHS domain-containing protein
MAKDPVCNMMVDMTTAQWTSEYEGQTYYFCAPGCKQAFEAEPTKYISGGASHEGHHADMHH